MVLDVARYVVVAAGFAAAVRRLELLEDLSIRRVHDVRDHAEAASMRHPDDGVRRAVGDQHAQDFLEHRDHDVQTLDREGLLAEERLAKVALERLDARQARQYVDLALSRKRDVVLAGLDVLAQPAALLGVGDVLDFVGDRRAIDVA